MSGLYLTIDDSPGGAFPQICAYLKSKNIPAVFFVRGDFLSLYPDRVVAAIADGFVIANHSWSHHHAGKLGADMAVREIDRAQTLIDECYKRAGVARPGPYLRFPHMDSGLGQWPLPPQEFSEAERKALEAVYPRFYNNSMTLPDENALATHSEIQTALKSRGYRQMDFRGVTIDWYLRYAASAAVSTQGTFCHPDWWLNARHLSKFPAGVDPVEQLNTNFDAYVAAHPGSAQILVMHDSLELWPYFPRLIDHMIGQGHNFLAVA